MRLVENIYMRIEKRFVNYSDSISDENEHKSS